MIEFREVDWKGGLKDLNLRLFFLLVAIRFFRLVEQLCLSYKIAKTMENTIQVDKMS